MNQYYTEIKVDSWETAINIFKKMNFLKNWVFRGQAKQEWDLTTSFERQFNKYSIDGYVDAEYLMEKDIVNQFISKAHLYESKLPPKHNILDWLGLLPTDQRQV
ncbi:MAG: FRG domain-containing protein [Candidatus Marinimicrobia bacterium]|nr:FRG domain-containing protein [Candidatus Neomarinimicrobiota bacterium]